VTPPIEIIAPHPSHEARAPSDVLRLAVAVATLLVLVVVGRLFNEAVVGFVADLLVGLDALPDRLISWLVVGGQAVSMAFLGGGFVMSVIRREWVLLASSLLAAGVALLLFALVEPQVDETALVVLDFDDSFALVAPDAIVSSGVLAAMAAVATTAGPWISRRWRRIAWLSVVLLGLVRFMGAPIAFDTLTAVLVGWVAGAAVIVLAGAPTRRPSGAAVAAGLAAVGVPLARLEQASVDARGSTPYFATSRDGSALFVKALGEDERSADLLFRVYRRLQPRDLGDERSFSSLRRAVEHEALVALASRDLGIRTPRLAAFATADPNGYVLAYEAIQGRSLDRLDADEMTDEVLAVVWEQLRVLRGHRVAHRDLRLANVFLADDGEVWIIDFGFSELASSDLLLANDLAEFVASSATQVGVDRAVHSALDAVGPDALATALDRLQLPMLSGATRTACKETPGLLDDLRVAVSAGT
jgi:undecaprenyl-diphosphatase